MNRHVLLQKAHVLTAFVFLLFIADVYCQNQHVSLNPLKTLPPPPEASSLGRFGDIPIGLHTGTAKISIPVYSLELNSITVPITLDYHSSGVKVDDISSNVGLAWALNAGGLISCTINGIYDFDPNYGYFTSASLIRDLFLSGDLELEKIVLDYDGSYSCEVTADSRYQLLKRLSEGGEDGEPDHFSFNFSGRSGSFVFDENGVPRTIPFSPIRISVNPDGSFQIVDEKGVKYIFAEKELSSLERAPGSDCDIINWWYSILNYTPTWYLSKIIALNGDEVTLSYDPISYSYLTPANETVFTKLRNNPPINCNDILPTKCQNIVNVIAGKRLSKIESNRGHTINFIYETTERKDLPGTAALKEITIKFNNKITKTWSLIHEYFESIPGQTIPENFRLKLTGVREIGKPAFDFEYDPTVLPLRHSARQDYWGYYNAKSNLTLIPGIETPDEVLTGANREPDANFMKAGVLTKIMYPTGGKTELSYEPHQYRLTGFRKVYQNKNTPFVEINNIGTITDTFTTGSSESPVPATFTFTTNVSQTLPPGDFLNCIVREYDTQQQVAYFETFSSTQTINLLPNKTYQIVLNSSTDVVSDPNGGYVQIYGSISGSWRETSTITVSENSTTGGLRVIETRDYADDTSQPIIKQFKYTIPDNESVSSGFCNQPVVNSYYQNIVKLNNEGTQSVGTCTYIARSSSSATQYSNIGYEYVTVLYGINGVGGKEVQKFLISPDEQTVGVPMQNDVSLSWPHIYRKSISYSWKRGMLLEHINYSNNSGTFHLVRKLTNSYHFDERDCHNCESVERNKKDIFGLKVLQHEPELNGIGTGSQCLRPGDFTLLPYYYPSEWFFLEKFEEVTRDVQNNNEITKTIKYFHDNYRHAQVTREVIDQSDGSEITTLRKYPVDYTINAANDDATIALKFLTDNNWISAVIENQVLKKNASEEVVVLSSFLTELKMFDGYALPKSQNIIEPVVPLSVFDGSGINSDGTFYKNSDYIEKVYFDRYDPTTKNLIQYHYSDNISISLLYGYQGNYIVAEIKNATADQVYYTSFEEVETNFSATAKTGDKGYTAAFTIPLPSQGGNYRLTYWKKANTGPWELVDDIISSSITIGGNGLIVDEVRVYPLDAQMTTYTYDPLIGITSQTDPNDLSTYFLYDEFGRLKGIKDDDGNIIKTYSYHYKE